MYKNIHKIWFNYVLYWNVSIIPYVSSWIILWKHATWKPLEKKKWCLNSGCSLCTTNVQYTYVQVHPMKYHYEHKRIYTFHFQSNQISIFLFIMYCQVDLCFVSGLYLNTICEWFKHRKLFFCFYFKITFKHVNTHLENLVAKPKARH